MTTGNTVADVRRCPHCRGTGRCPRCGGHGCGEQDRCERREERHDHCMRRCEECNNTGMCVDCDGRGYV